MTSRRGVSGSSTPSWRARVTTMRNSFPRSGPRRRVEPPVKLRRAIRMSSAELFCRARHELSKWLDRRTEPRRSTPGGGIPADVIAQCLEEMPGRFFPGASDPRLNDGRRHLCDPAGGRCGRLEARSMARSQQDDSEAAPTARGQPLRGSIDGSQPVPTDMDLNPRSSNPYRPATGATNSIAVTRCVRPP